MQGKPLTREELEGKLRKALLQLETLAENTPRGPQKANIVARYTDCLTRAMGTLFPRPTTLELATKPNFDGLTPQEQLRELQRARERLDVIEAETKLLAQASVTPVSQSEDEDE